MKPYYNDGSSVIYHADCTEFGREVGYPEAQCVVTSPLYNSGVDYDGYDDNVGTFDYVGLAEAACNLMAAAIQLDWGRAWVNVGVEKWWIWSHCLRKAGFYGQTTVCWDYGIPTRDCAWGSWRSPAAPHFRYGWEPVICGWPMQWKREAPEGLECWRDGLGGWERLACNIWRIAPGASQANGHPAVMPLELATCAIRLSTWPGEVVLDPFMGSGTTLLAARLLGRQAIGIEVSERYCELAANRLAQQILSLDAQDTDRVGET